MNKRYDTPIAGQFVIIGVWVLVVGSLAIFFTVVSFGGWLWHWKKELFDARELP